VWLPARHVKKAKTNEVKSEVKYMLNYNIRSFQNNLLLVIRDQSGSVCKIWPVVTLQEHLYANSNSWSAL